MTKSQYKVGGIIGYWYEQTLKNAGVTIEYVINDEQNIKKLLAKKIDLALLSDISGWYLLKTQFPKDIDKFATVDFDLPSKKPKEEDIANCLIVSKQNKNGTEILKTFNSGLKKIKNNGEYSKILAKYGIK